MENNEIINIVNRMDDFDKRDEVILAINEEIALELEKQNIHIEKIVKGYFALGIVAPDNGEMKTEEPTTNAIFIHKISDLEKEHQVNKLLLSKPEDKFESKKIVEDYITKKFDLISARWYSIVAYFNLLRSRRFESRDESLALMNEYAVLENYDENNWNQKAEELFKKHTEMLDYQEKHLLSEEELMNELELLLSLRTELLELANETFLD